LRIIVTNVKIGSHQCMHDPDLDRLWAVIPEARIVGGAVRDRLARLAVADIDLASPLGPEIVTARLERAGLRAIPTGLAHGTITALVGERSFEITTLRRDVDTDGRRAVVAFIDDWRADAARRDFTINAMSMEQDGTIHDYFGGRADLVAGRVRFVGEAALRIAEDYLRILRFFRFFARYGRGRPDAAAVSAITALRAGLAGLSAERVWQELRRILAARDPRAALQLMRRTGVMDMVLPEVGSLAALEAMIAREGPIDPLLRFAALVPDDPAIAARLKLSEAERVRIEALHRAPLLAADADDVTLRRALADFPAEVLIERSWWAPEDDRAGLRARLATLPRPVFPLKGRDVLALGVAPGPRIGQALAATREWWLEDGCVADRASCLDDLARRLAAQGSDDQSGR